MEIFFGHYATIQITVLWEGFYVVPAKYTGFFGSCSVLIIQLISHEQSLRGQLSSLLGPIHILRKYIFRIFGPLPPYMNGPLDISQYGQGQSE